MQVDEAEDEEAQVDEAENEDASPLKRNHSDSDLSIISADGTGYLLRLARQWPH